MSSHYAQQAQALVLRLPEHLEEGVRQRLREGSLDGVQLTARPDGVEGLRASIDVLCLCLSALGDMCAHTHTHANPDFPILPSTRTLHTQRTLPRSTACWTWRSTRRSTPHASVRVALLGWWWGWG